ncbi:unnamed protein product [Arctogadus glacialis]
MTATLTSNIRPYLKIMHLTLENFDLEKYKTCLLLLQVTLITSYSSILQDADRPYSKGLEKSNTFLSASDTFLWEPITMLAFPLGALLAGLTTGKRGSSQSRTESVELGPLITPLVLKKMTAASPDPHAIYD